MSRSAALLTPSLLAEATILHADLAAVIERSHDLCWWGRGRRLGAGPFINRPIAGSSDAKFDLGLIVSVLTAGVSLCADCIATKTGIPLGQVGLVLARIGTTVKVGNEAARCDACLRMRKVYRLP